MPLPKAAWPGRYPQSQSQAQRPGFSLRLSPNALFVPGCAVFRKWGERVWVGYLLIALILWGGLFLLRWLLPVAS